MPSSTKSRLLCSGEGIETMHLKIIFPTKQGNMYLILKFSKHLSKLDVYLQDNNFWTNIWNSRICLSKHTCINTYVMYLCLPSSDIDSRNWPVLSQWFWKLVLPTRLCSVNFYRVHNPNPVFSINYKSNRQLIIHSKSKLKLTKTMSI